MKIIRHVSLILPTALLAAGSANFMGAENQRTHNRQQLSLLHAGMAKEEVTRVMGNKEGSWCHASIFLVCIRSETLSNPYRTAGFEAQGRQYEVLYYYTDEKVAEKAIVDDELTPVLLENDKLVGWGRDLIEGTLKKYEIRMR